MIEMDNNVQMALFALADLIGEDRQKVEGDAVNGMAFDWRGLRVEVVIRSSWVEMFDDETGETLISMAVPNSEAIIRVRRPADGHGKGWSNFISEPAPLGFYHKNNRIAHFLKS